MKSIEVVHDYVIGRIKFLKQQEKVNYDALEEMLSVLSCINQFYEVQI